ncbi:MAG TPA: patatin-like phospholipase family protein [Terracidiphilus sp.]|nr:patatin-like phospholipase family protein [Terracidiphilus sp.]
MASYRVLSLDGGGSWALIQVMALMKLHGENATGHEVLRKYDLVAATSGGSIVLGGLVEDLTLDALLDFFLSEEKRRSIFVEKELHLPATPKYRTEGKLEGLTAAFPLRGGMMMAEAAKGIVSENTGQPVHLLITGFDYDRNRGRFFRSAPASGAEWGDGDQTDVQMVEAIHASTNAPVLYFDVPAELASEPGKRYWDGGVSGCNNPVLAGVTEAVVLGNKPDAIAALALGTGSVMLPQRLQGAEPVYLYAPGEKSSWLHDVKKMAESILDDPPDAASFLSHVMTGGRPPLPPPADSRVVRMNPLVAPVRDDAAGNWRLPDGMSAEDFEALTNMAMDAIEQEDVLKIQHLAALWTEDNVCNQPVRMNWTTQEVEIGQGRFSQAVAAWTLLRAEL